MAGNPLVEAAFAKLDDIAEQIRGLRDDQGRGYDDVRRESFSAVARLIADGATATVVRLAPTLGEVWNVKGLAVQADAVAARNVAITFGDGRPVAIAATVVGAVGVGGVVSPDYNLPDGGELQAIFPIATPAGTECILHVWGDRIMPEEAS